MTKKAMSVQTKPAKEHATPERVIANRGGEVLGKRTILKSDHFPGCHNAKLLPNIKGAPNYRQVHGLPVFGVAIPTLRGLETMLEYMGGKSQRFLWHNMREEPVLYVNGKPYVLRDVESPFANLEYTGIAVGRVEDMEKRMKADVLAEAEAYGSAVLVSIENDDGSMMDVWEKLETPSAVQTPRDVYEDLVREGYSIDYRRVPMTDEKPPKERDCDRIAHNISTAPADTLFVFNCQMGRGRTTTGMIIACMVCLRNRPPAEALPPAPKPKRDPECSPSDAVLLDGEFAVVRSLTRVLEIGRKGKELLDDIIDRCSAMQNLREAILTYRRYLGAQDDEKRKAAAYRRGVEYLERYYVLIAFAAYTISGRFDAGPAKVSFEQWCISHPELESILQRMLWKNPISALQPPEEMKKHPSQTSIQEVAALPDDALSAEAVVRRRRGRVLTNVTMLKKEPFPGLHKPGLPVIFSDAPNFRQVEGAAVYGIAIPSMAAARKVVRHAKAHWPGRPVLWVNLREEPVVYIDETPYVLREVGRPFQNLQEYSGISASDVERMEVRLKEDVDDEASKYHGKILVCHEEENFHLGGVWIEGELPPGEGKGEAVDRSAAATPSEAFAALAEEVQGEGIRLQYMRLPITHQRAPKRGDFDRLAADLFGLREPSVLVFSCQGGAGRTTTAMVMACLCLQMGSPDRGLAALGDELPSAEAREDSLPPDADADRLLHGDYLFVRKLIRMLPGGGAAKARLDKVIDLCGRVENIREVIATDKLQEQSSRAAFVGNKMDRRIQDAMLKLRVEQLERYATLIAFTAWLDCGPERPSFTQWLGDHPEVRQVKESIRANPLQALEHIETSSRSRFASNASDTERGRFASGASDSDRERPDGALPTSPMSPASAAASRGLSSALSSPSALSPPPAGSGDAADAVDSTTWAAPSYRAVESASEEASVVAARRGLVLGPHAVLKRYEFPGQRTQSSLPGVPSFVRAADGLPVCACATGPASGIKAILAHMGTGRDSAASPRGHLSRASKRRRTTDKAVIVTDVREETVLYIHGQPYVLREKDRPTMDICNEGIVGSALDRLESHLRDDVLKEAAHYGGKILVHTEEHVEGAGAGGAPAVLARWLVLEGDAADAVCTPAQLYARLQADGAPITYKRIPLSGSRPVQPADLDLLRQHCTRPADPALALTPQPELLFVSHTGHGSVGYAMALACSVLTNGALLQDIVLGSRKMDPIRSAAWKEREAIAARTAHGNPEEIASARKMAGEYKDIMALLRALQMGVKAKQAADWAIDSCSEAGNVRKDLFQCSNLVPFEVSRLAESYFNRYFLLIAFNSYIVSRGSRGAPPFNLHEAVASSGPESTPDSCCFICGKQGHIARECEGSFAQWMAARPELQFILEHAKIG